MKLFCIFISLLLWQSFTQIPEQQNNSTLRAVIQIFRHGIRDSFNREGEFGDLTPPGLRQQYLLGSALRQEYVFNQNFLSENYSAFEYKIFSSDTQRTLESAYSQLRGLFPNGPVLVNLNHSLPQNKLIVSDPNRTFPGLENGTALPYGYQPVPVHTSSNSYNSLKTVFKACPTFNQIVDANKRGRIYRELVSEFDSTIREAFRLSNIDFASVAEEDRLNKISKLYSDILVDHYNNRSTVTVDPADPFWQNFTFLATITKYVTYFQTDFQKRLSATHLFTEFKEFLDAKIKGTTPLKWLAYSAHDTNILQVLSGLNVSRWECINNNFHANRSHYNTPNCYAERPSFSSNVVLELHEVINAPVVGKETKSKRYERFAVNLLIDGVPYPLCNNKTSCSYSEFRYRIRDYVFNEDFHKICGLPDTDLDSSIKISGAEGSVFNIFLIIFIMIETVVIIGLFLRLWDSRKNSKKLYIEEEYKEQTRPSSKRGLNAPLITMNKEEL